MFRLPGAASATSTVIEQLEARTLLAWGPYARLIDQDLAVAKYPNVTGKGVNTATIDSGIDFNHPQLQGVVWTNPGEIPNNGIDDDHDGLIDDVHGWDYYRGDNVPNDENSHGTQMAGIIAAKHYTHPLDGYEYQGIAPDAKIIPFKIVDPYGETNDLAFHQRIEKALKWVLANHVRYNISIVLLAVHGVEDLFKQTFADEVAQLNKEGVFMIASAGHYGRSDTLIYPAEDPNVYAAGMVNINDQIPEEEQRGPQLDILAPGSAVPILHKGSSYLISGEATSYPPPFIAGAAALIKQIDPNFTPAQIMSILQDSGKPIHDPGGLTYPRLDLDDAIALAYKRSGQADPGVQKKPFRANPFNIGQKIEAEDFDIGGEGVSFHDLNTTDLHSSYRGGPVAIGSITDGKNGHDVTSVRAGEWLEYTLDISDSFLYNFEARVQSTGSGGKFHVEIDGVNKTGTISISNSSKWQSIKKSGIALTSGQHIVRIVFDKETSKKTVGNFNWFRFSRA